MIHPYDPVLLNTAQQTLGNTLDYAVYSLHQNADQFIGLFIASGLAGSFQAGDISVIAGMSGTELACRVMESCGLEYERVRPRFTTGKSKEYVCGAVLARTQWQTGLSFSDITGAFPASDIIDAYDVIEKEYQRKLADIWPPVMDAGSPEKTAKRINDAIVSLTDSLHEKMSSARNETHLKSIRLLAGMSQSQLADASNVPVRTIQQYEQRQKDINKARSEYVIRLSSALHCSPADILE